MEDTSVNTREPMQQEKVHEEESWAMSILSDYKKQAKRWFIAFIVTLVLYVLTVAGIVGCAVYVLTNYEFDVLDSDSSQATNDGSNYNIIIDSEGNVYWPNSTSELG